MMPSAQHFTIATASTSPEARARDRSCWQTVAVISHSMIGSQLVRGAALHALNLNQRSVYLLNAELFSVFAVGGATASLFRYETPSQTMLL